MPTYQGACKAGQPIVCADADQFGANPITTTTAHAFETVIAAWDKRPRCEMTTSTGHQCRRQAAWRLNLHGCEHALLCGQHQAAWIRNATANTLAGCAPRCAHCGHVFTTVDDAYTAGPL
jgi:hypothetical protein